MSDEKTLKEQRDRYVAFAFAAGDLFLEISEDGKIVYAAGASKPLTGIDDKKLVGMNWLSLFAAYEQGKMTHMKEQAVTGKRVGPALVALNESIGQRMAMLSAIKMPTTQRFYLTLGVSNEFLAKIAPFVGLPGSVGFVDNFAEAARDAIFDAKLWGQDVALSFFDFPSTYIEEAIKHPDWGQTQTIIGEVMAQYSFGGFSAGEVAEGRYSFVHDRAIDVAEVQQKIIYAVKQAGLNDLAANIQTKTVDTNIADMSKKDISRALDHTLDAFESGGTATTLDNLQKSYSDYLSSNDAKLKEFKSIIERVSFSQLFQPIVNMQTREAAHYEILAKFEKGKTQEWIRFGEDAGLAPDFDLAVLDRAINFVKFKAGGTRTKFSVDISGQSINNEKFLVKFHEFLAKDKQLAERLSFEITESANIEDLNKASGFIRDLQNKGFKVALDDFHPSAAVQQYLQTLRADFVKLDGRYTARLTASAREGALIRGLVEMCQHAGTEVIAECVETEAQHNLLRDMGVRFAQGYFYAHPGPKPEYSPR